MHCIVVGINCCSDKQLYRSTIAKVDCIVGQLLWVGIVGYYNNTHTQQLSFTIVVSFNNLYQCTSTLGHLGRGGGGGYTTA